MRHSAVWAALRLRADLISTMPVDTFLQGGRRAGGDAPPSGAGQSGRRFGGHHRAGCTRRSSTLTRAVTRSLDLGPRRGGPADAHQSRASRGRGGSRHEGRSLSYRIAGVDHEPRDVWHGTSVHDVGQPGWVVPAGAFGGVGGRACVGAGVRALVVRWWRGSVRSPEEQREGAEQVREGRSGRRRFKRSPVATGDVFVTGKDWEYSMLAAKASESGMIDSLRWGIGDAFRFYECLAT